MKERMIAAAFLLAALVQLAEAVLCGTVWRQFNSAGALEPGQPVDLAPFPGGFTTLRVLWFVGIALAVLMLLLTALPPRPMLMFLAGASAGFGAYGLWVTSARPDLGDHGTRVLGTNQGFPEATILYAVAAGLAVLGVLLARPSRTTPKYDS
jgi:hypothetical protein